MLTQDDLNEVEEIIEEKTKNLPTKDEFYKETLRILSKLDDLEISMDIITSRQSEHSDKIEALEKIHPQGIHTATI